MEHSEAIEATGNKYLNQCFANTINTMLPNVISFPDLENDPTKLLHWFFPF